MRIHMFRTIQPPRRILSSTFTDPVVPGVEVEDSVVPLVVLASVSSKVQVTFVLLFAVKRKIPIPPVFPSIQKLNCWL